MTREKHIVAGKEDTQKIWAQKMSRKTKRVDRNLCRKWSYMCECYKKRSNHYKKSNAFDCKRYCLRIPYEKIHDPYPEKDRSINKYPIDIIHTSIAQNNIRDRIACSDSGIPNSVEINDERNRQKNNA